MRQGFKMKFRGQAFLTCDLQVIVVIVILIHR